MLNLLFISDNPKIEYIKNVLQPVLKVVIDVVPDFDHGLKDVFEKRPATVCIQDQIAGITGESVARHIKMLLGTGAPTFILIHEGNGKAKFIKGLFDYVVDLNQPDAKLAEQLQNTLKIIVGDQWDKVYIPPAQTTLPVSPLSVVSEDSRKDADKLVDDFLADLETTGFTATADAPAEQEPDVTQVESFVTQTSEEILNEMQLEHNTQVRMQELAAEKAAVTPPVAQADTDELANMLLEQSKQSRLAEMTSTQPFAGPVGADDKAEEMVKHQTGFIAVSKMPPVTPANFRIRHGKPTAAEEIPDDLLQAFEKNYQKESNARKRVIVAVSALLLILMICGWYFVTQNSSLLAVLKHPLSKSAKTSPVPVVSQPAPSAAPAPAAQTTPQIAVVKSELNATLPVFIPKAGHDKSYAEKNPGWERYIDKRAEFRVFSADGKIKAVQVLAVAGNVIPEALVQSILIELTGSSDYKIASRENKSGFLVLSASAAQKVDLLFYKKNSTLRAFVVSIN